MFAVISYYYERQWNVMKCKKKKNTSLWKSKQFSKQSVSDTEIVSRPLVQISSANCWYWNEGLIQVLFAWRLWISSISHILGPFFWQRCGFLLGLAAAISPSYAKQCQRSLRRLCSFNPSWRELTWHLFISAKCSREEAVLPNISRHG